MEENNKNTRIEKVKKHIKDNKKTYITIGGGIGLAAAFAAGVKLAPKVAVTQQAISGVVGNWKPSILQHIEIIVEVPARGHRGFKILNEMTKETYGSISHAAQELGVNRSIVREHLLGLRPDINGQVLRNLGENLDEIARIAA